MGSKYKKCPRCELNYILSEEDYCHVCKTEMKHFNEGEDDGLLDDFEDMELCPSCGVNYIKVGQTSCSDCKNKKSIFDDDNSKTWKKDEDEEDDDSLIGSDIDGDDDRKDEDPYNPGFEEVDLTEDPYKIDDDPLLDDIGSSIEFSSDFDDDFEDEDEEIVEYKDDFEVVEVSDDDDDEEDEDDYNKYDDDDDTDFLGKKKK